MSNAIAYQYDSNEKTLVEFPGCLEGFIRRDLCGGKFCTAWYTPEELSANSALDESLYGWNVKPWDGSGLKLALKGLLARLDINPAVDADLAFLADRAGIDIEDARAAFADLS